MQRAPWSVALLFSVLGSVACSSGPEGAGGTSSSGGGTAPEATTARCVGKPVEAYTMRDSTSCSLQGAEWRRASLECGGTTFSVYCGRADTSSGPDEAKKSACLDMPGCGWTEDDGSITKPTGRCEGTKTACSAFSTSSECKAQPGCNYLTGDCEKSNGFNYLDNSDCGSLQIGNSVSFSVVRSACERAKGCTWVDE
jgi:hypothetical protein